MTSRRYLGLLAASVLLLTACQPSGPVLVKPDNTAVTQAQNAEQSGDYSSAAQLYLDIANKLQRPDKSVYLFKAASAYYQLKQFDQVTQTLTDVFAADLAPAQQVEMALMQANIALSYGDGEQALTYFVDIDSTLTTRSQQQQILNLKVQSYELLQNWLEIANSRIKLATLISADQQQINQEKLWHALMQLSPEALDVFNSGMPPATDSGWFALAYAVRAYQANPDAMIVAIEDWRRNYPSHPANPELYKKNLNTGTRLPSQLEKIAVLLPSSGPYKNAADAIKQGIVAQHFLQRSGDNLLFLEVDTDRDNNYSNVASQYQRAIAQQASLVIGPLDKIAVEQLAQLNELPIPVLALNRTQSPVEHANFFQFGLAPEDDAIAAANYATEQGMKRAVILSPQGSWGDRIADAFVEQWRKNGGALLRHSRYDDVQSDFSDTIKPLFSLDDSERRYKQMKQLISPNLEFEPRRRQDIDFLFLIAKPLKARQLVPQLKFHRSGKMPVIATSHAYSGQPNPQQDIDINGIRIADIPWMLSPTNDPVYSSLSGNAEHGGLLRLYALGADAYRLIADLNRMSRSPDVYIEGATGLLNIDAERQVKRQPLWATFKDGYIQALSLSD